MNRALITLIITLLLSSCSGILGPVKIPEVNTYTLAATGYAAHARHQKKITLMLATPTASPGYQSKKMIYNKRPLEVKSFTKNQWAGTPADMLQPLLLQSLRDTGYFHAVIAPPISAERHYRLAVNLIELRQDFTREPSRVRMVLQASVVDDSSNKVLASRVFSSVIATKCDSPYGGVVAANKATYRILGAVSLFCVNTIAHPPRLNAYNRLNLPEPK